MELVPLTRGLVCRAVEAYGRAWTTQDSDLIARLFTEDAVYVERVFDASATMRGRQAIRAYWDRQICGKQSGIAFRHADSEMVLDPDRRVAVVTWLAEFDNVRRLRGDASEKKVRFVQVAKLHFSDDATQITYLEEYAQGASGSKFNWPQAGLDEHATPGTLLRRMIRGDPGAFATVGKAAVCKGCQETFPSRAQLFKHLRRSNGCGVDAVTGASVSNAAFDPPSVAGKPQLRKVGVSVSYWRWRPRGEAGEPVGDGGHFSTDALQVALAVRLTSAYRRAFPKFASANIGGDALTVLWAAPPHRARQACINVASVLLPKSLVESADDCAEIGRRWDKALSQAPEELENADMVVRIRACHPLPRAFSPRHMSECERYFGIVRVRELISGPAFRGLVASNGDHSEGASAPVRVALHSRLHEFARFFSGSTHSFHNFTTMSAQAISAGKKKMTLRLSRVRAAALPAPWQDDWICIKMTVRHLLRGMLGKVMGAIVALVRGDLGLDDVKAALRAGPGETTATEEKEGGGGSGEFGAAAALQQLHLVSGTTPMPMFPEHRIVLVSPAMPRFESKAKLKFCLGKSYFRETSWGEGVVEEVIKATLAEASADLCLEM